MAAQPNLSALEQLIRAMQATPQWVETCMKLRNSVAQLLGLKNSGGLGSFDLNKAEATYKVGDRLGIFTLLEITADEVLVGDNDKHLNVVVSISCDRKSAEQTIVTVTTIVHVHNWLGKLYMLPVAPMHKLIAPAVTKAIG
ncbi:DUF2867 domain-containing protein [Thiofilum flexile]|uniref:DUF2867 domain-containing protein n=1 Tax=Thiofilum flexile TaxID=125627 RepID=UPI000380045E|nr:DUF2867 domain-containing protein [Thiofilum flexile]